MMEKEIKKSIKSELNELRREKKRFTELEKEQRKKKKEWEIKIKMIN